MNPVHPKLAGSLRVDGDLLLVDGVDSQRRRVRAGELSAVDLMALLQRMDGETPLEALVGDGKLIAAGEAQELVRVLDEAGLIDDPAPPAGRTGSEVILEIEELVEAHCSETIYVNPFWTTCLSALKPGDLPEKLATGMVIENWHFLFRESYFDAPILSYVPNTAVRLLLNQFFSEEYGHDEILLRTLNFVGIGREEMLDAIPLPETMALCNALAYWSHNDPLFFFATLGLLEGQGMKQDSFIEACDRCGFPEGFVKPLRTHANINIGAAHGNLTRAIFREIPVIDALSEARLKRQIPLFVQLYDNFYRGVWRHYTSDGPLLRRVRDA